MIQNTHTTIHKLYKTLHKTTIYTTEQLYNRKLHISTQIGNNTKQYHNNKIQHTIHKNTT